MYVERPMERRGARRGANLLDLRSPRQCRRSIANCLRRCRARLPKSSYAVPPTQEIAMNIKDRYLAYADAFELSFDDDDWSRIAPFFTEDAVYEGDPPARGRDAVLAKLKSGVDNFDRRMDSRTPDFETPKVDGNTLTMKWKVTYTKAGLPDLVISGTETALFKGDRIASLRDDFDPKAQQTMATWMKQHGAALAG